MLNGFSNPNIVDRPIRRTRCPYSPYYMEFRLNLSKGMLRTVRQDDYKEGAFMGRFADRTPPEDIITAIERSGLVDAGELQLFLHPMLAGLAKCTMLDSPEDVDRTRKEMQVEKDRINEHFKAYRVWLMQMKDTNVVKPKSENVMRIVEAKRMHDQADHMLGCPMETREKVFADEEDSDEDMGGVRIDRP